jgi:hypothetical protein
LIFSYVSIVGIYFISCYEFQFSIFADEHPYALKDTKNEEAFGIKLSDSLARARRVPLFREVRFYITPSTEPGVGPLKEIIENAGGTVVSRRSPARVIATQKTSQVNIGMLWRDS